MTWERPRGRIQAHVSGAQVVAVRIRDSWMYDAWGAPGSATTWPWTAVGKRRHHLGSHAKPERARAACEASIGLVEDA